MSATDLSSPMPLAMAALPLIAVGETLAETASLTRADIASFSRASFDANPLHLDPQAAARAGFDDVIASGQQTAALLMGMLATHYSRDDDGVRREMLCLNMNFAFKEPVLADREFTLRWRVASVEWKERLGGLLAHLDGTATPASGPVAVVARGTILVKEAVVGVVEVEP
jgi:acyl dehydratase